MICRIVRNERFSNPQTRHVAAKCYTPTILLHLEFWSFAPPRSRTNTIEFCSTYQLLWYCCRRKERLQTYKASESQFGTRNDADSENGQRVFQSNTLSGMLEYLPMYTGCTQLLKYWVVLRAQALTPFTIDVYGKSRGRWQDLALSRQQLVACDRACAAAADAFAMKVVAAGGLEPRYGYAPGCEQNALGL